MTTTNTNRIRNRKPLGFISYLDRLMEMLDEKQQQTGNTYQLNHQLQKGEAR